MNKLDWVVSPAIAGHYKVINTTSPILHSKVGDVDLRKVTLNKADEIFSVGTRYLEKIAIKKFKSKITK